METAVIVGHQDGHGWEVRGNEDLSELRVGVRVGRSRWVQAQFVKGLATFSPAAGLLLSAGVSR